MTLPTIHYRHLRPKTGVLDLLTESPGHCLNYALLIIFCDTYNCAIEKYDKPVIRGKLIRNNIAIFFFARLVQLTILQQHDFSTSNLSIIMKFA